MSAGGIFALPPAQRSLIFSSVFPSTTATHTIPTPLATPDLSSLPPNSQAFAYNTPSQFATSFPSSEPAAREIRRDIAWSTATRVLSLPRPPQTAGLGLSDRYWERQRVQNNGGEGVEDAIRYLTVGEGEPSQEGQDRTLVDWYGHEVKQHLGAYVQPRLRGMWKQNIEVQHALDLLRQTSGMLRHVQQFYLQALEIFFVPALRDEQAEDGRSVLQSLQAKFQRELHAAFRQAVPLQLYSKALSLIIYSYGQKMFQLDHSNEDRQQVAIARAEMTTIAEQTLTVLLHLQEVGLGNELGERALGHACNELIDSFIDSYHMKVDWYGQEAVTTKLRQWIEEGLAPFVRQCMDCFNDDQASISEIEVHQWQEMAIARLGRDRVGSLFDYVVRWPRSEGAIRDLKEYITNPEARIYLTTHFTTQLQRRLLHAGATTTHILDTYIYIIRAFEHLDPKGVLLDRVARHVRRYLKERDDTARIIVSSLLAPYQEAPDGVGVIIDTGPEGAISALIAEEMSSGGLPTSGDHDHDHDTDWNNMSWQPDPIDASPDFRKSKPEDTISYLLSLYDREEFINELKTILGAHLLDNQDSDFEREIRLLELFKLRLGDDKLQAAEVMLRDVLESKRMNVSITKHINLPSSDPDQPKPVLNAQILSGFFWPALREDDFHLPGVVVNAMAHYEAAFKAFKDRRKLQWLPALGQVTVELDLADRKVEVKCQTWQASVIHAFADDEGDGNGAGEGGAKRTVDQLVETLEMDENLVFNALTFWVSERVLHESSPGSYIVLERLPSSTSGSTNVAAEAAQADLAAASAPAVSALVSAEDVLEQNRAVYEQFVLSMLTNQGALPAMMVHRMMKMVMPGGFQGGVEDVGRILEGLMERGMVEARGQGVWGVKK